MAMKPFQKAALVLGGYVICIALAFIVVAAHVATTGGADRQSSGGMHAFGDTLLFVLVFGVTGLIPTGTALFYLRPYAAFWKTFSAVALLVAATSVAAVVLYIVGRGSPSPTLSMLSGYSVLRILLSPILSLVFAVCAVCSPSRGPRIAFIASAVVEAAVGIAGAVTIFLHMQ